MSEKKERKGVAKQSKEELKKRREIGRELLEEYGYKIYKPQFIEEYRNAIAERTNLGVPSDNRTYYADLAYLEDILKKEQNQSITYLAEETEKISENIIYKNLAIQLNDVIRYVILSVGGKEYVLYKKTLTKVPTLKKFKAKVNEVYDFKKDEEHWININTLAHAHIIFDTSGYEVLTSNFFNNNGESEKILYTAPFNYCTDVVSRVGNLPSFMEMLYYTIYG